MGGGEAAYEGDERDRTVGARGRHHGKDGAKDSRRPRKRTGRRPAETPDGEEALEELTGFLPRFCRILNPVFDRIHKVRETKKAIYIHLSDTQAWILPKSQMAGEEEAARLLEMLSSVIESGRLQLRKR